MMASSSHNRSLHRAYIGLGSNIGDGEALLQRAWQLLNEQEGIQTSCLSSPYRSAPVGMESDHWFTNGVGSLMTSLAPESLLDVLLDIEYRLGRRRDSQVTGYQDRSLDLDMLYYDDLVLETVRLVLPHPRIAERLFVLQPLLEVVAGETASELRLYGPRYQTLQGMRADLERHMQEGKIPYQEIVQRCWKRDFSFDETS